jgi:hypothetical protein
LLPEIKKMIFFFYINNKFAMANTTLHPDQSYIEGLANNDSAIIQSIYKKFVPRRFPYIRNNSGDEDQAQDVVQEIMIVLFNQAKSQSLQLSCPLIPTFFLYAKVAEQIKKASNKV